MIEANFNVQGDLLGLESEASKLVSDTVTLDDGTEHKCNDGTTFLAVDTGKLRILYNKTWYIL